MSPPGSVQLEHPGQDGGSHPPCRDRLRGPPEELGKPSRERAFWVCHPKTAAPATLTSVKDMGIFCFKGDIGVRSAPPASVWLFQDEKSEIIQFCRVFNL